MAFAGLLREKHAIIAERWRQAAMAIYSPASAIALDRSQDPFAYPAGHALLAGTQAAVTALADGQAPAEIAAALDEIIQIRAVQEFAPSQAMAFVFFLKDAIRSEVTADAEDLLDCERQIDQVALATFDIYMQYRQRICDLRVLEIQRLACLAGKAGQRK